MSPCSSLLISAALTVAGGVTEAATPLALTREGWTVTADGERGLLTVSHDRLGTVLQDVRLNLQGEHGLVPWTTFSAETKGARQLLLRTAAPGTVWLVEPRPDTTPSSCTSPRERRSPGCRRASRGRARSRFARTSPAGR